MDDDTVNPKCVSASDFLLITKTEVSFNKKPPDKSSGPDSKRILVLKAGKEIKSAKDLPTPMQDILKNFLRRIFYKMNKIWLGM